VVLNSKELKKLLIKIRKEEAKLFSSRKTTKFLFFLIFVYFIFVSVPILFLIKKRFKAKKLYLGHYHIPFKFFSIEVLETFIFRQKIYKIEKYLIITDIHLGLADYNEEQLKKLKEFLASNKNILILGDLTERFPKRRLNKKEKEIIDLILNKNDIIYIKGNHDPDFDKQVLFFFDEKNKLLFIHGHQSYFLFFPKSFFDLIKLLNQKHKG